MRKLLVASAVALAVMASSSLAVAGHHRGGPQGFQNQAPTTVAGVMQTAYDDQYVTLQGRLIAYLGHDRYSFQDATGIIEVELDDDRDWSFISKNELIQIIAKVDKDFWNTELEVKQAFSLENGQAQLPPGPKAPPAPPAPPAPKSPAAVPGF